jgi:hypothetical protein
MQSEPTIIAIHCPNWIVARALTRLTNCYARWEVHRCSTNGRIRRLGLWAKTRGIVEHDRLLACQSEPNEWCRA